MTKHERRQDFEEIDPDEDDDEDEDGPDLLRVRMTADAARLFVVRAARVVAAGRPPCPLCGAPLDPQGHICPRRNGRPRVKRARSARRAAIGPAIWTRAEVVTLTRGRPEGHLLSPCLLVLAGPGRPE